VVTQVFLKSIDDNGLEHTIKLFKEFLRLVSRYVMYQDPKQPQMGPHWIKTNKEGIPKVLKFSRDQIIRLRSDTNFSRMVLTYLSMYKLFHVEIDYDTSTITDPLKNPRLMMDVSDRILGFIRTVARTLRIEKFEKSKEHPVHVTLKAGAYGPRSMGVTSLFDIASSQNEGLLDTSLKMANLVYQESSRKIFSDLVNESLEATTSLPKVELKQSSRLHFISEGGGKTRIVCIGDI